MNKPPLKNFSKHKKKLLSNRKKHVETMFLTNKTKHHPYYHKNRRLANSREANVINLTPPFFSMSARALESGYLTLKPLKSIARFFKWFSKNYSLSQKIKLDLFLFPDFVLTSKPKEVRMGKGKGTNLQKVAPVKSGQILFSINVFHFANIELAHILMKKLSFKIPLRHTTVTNDW